jgi:glycosyltransferase involved in cell wall biosynthesis
MDTMLGGNHSWSVVMRSLAKGFLSLNNSVYLKSTNGLSDVDKSLLKFINKTNNSYDLDICYTLPRNFKARFNSKSNMKAAIYNYESSGMPKEWTACHKHIDFLFPSSNFSKDIFIANGWPEEKCIVIPHGVDLDSFKEKRPCVFATKKKFKFLNVSIPHYRKNIDLVIDAYYNAFTEDDDVCLLLKTSMKRPKLAFECDVKNLIMSVQSKYRNKNLPQIEVVTKNFDSMIPLYNGVDCLVSASSSEGFGLPLLEAIAADKIVIAPHATGQIDFLNDKNSLLIDTRVVKADRRYQYWRPSPNATTYMPNVQQLSEKMLDAYNNYNDLYNKLSNGMRDTVNKFTWENACKEILKLL